MAAQLIDGRQLAAEVKSAVRCSIDAAVALGRHRPGLAVVKVGDDPASAVYVRDKRRACEEVGINSFAYDLPADTREAQLLALIDELNRDARIDGILVQLPLPQQIGRTAVIERIDPVKDVDGFRPYNIGRLGQRLPLMRPCTPYGVIRLLEHIGAPFKGQNAVVVGWSGMCVCAGSRARRVDHTGPGRRGADDGRRADAQHSAGLAAPAGVVAVSGALARRARARCR